MSGDERSCSLMFDDDIKKNLLDYVATAMVRSCTRVLFKSMRDRCTDYSSSRTCKSIQRSSLGIGTHP
jgi:hypothetical protein